MKKSNSQMTCPHCELTKDGRYLCKKTKRACSKIFCPYEKDNYEDNYGIND